MVLIHTNGLGLFGQSVFAGYLFDELSRFAVPCFFVVSGFFWKAERFTNVPAASMRLIKKIGLIFLCWVAFYFAAEFSGLYEPAYKAKLTGYVIAIFTGGPGYHLWFLPALIMGSIICWTLIQAMGVTRALWICGGLYVTGVMIGTYGPMLGIRLPIFAFRNGIFEAPMFLMCGYLMQSRQMDLGRRYFLIMAILGLVIHLVEGDIAGKFPHGHDFSFGTLPFAIGIFGIFSRMTLPVGAGAPMCSVPICCISSFCGLSLHILMSRGSARP